MTASDIGYFALGAGFMLTIKLLIAWAEASTAAKEARERLDQAIEQRSPEYAHDYLEREARRVERPLEERSVPGVVVKAN